MAKHKVPINYEVEVDEVVDEALEADAVVDDDDDVDVIDDDAFEDDEQADDDSKRDAELDAKLDERERRLRERADASGDAQTEAMREVAATLKELRQQPQTQQVREQVEDIEAFKKRIKDGFYDDPVAAVEALTARRIQEYEEKTLKPALMQMGKVLRDTALSSSKQRATTDTSRIVLEKYADEVEKEIDSGRITIGPDAYDEAIARVAARHLDEVIEAKIKATADKTDGDKREAGNKSPSRGAAAPRDTRSAVITKSTEARIYAEADRAGANREQYKKWFIRKHPDRVKKWNKGGE